MALVPKLGIPRNPGWETLSYGIIPKTLSSVSAKGVHRGTHRGRREVLGAHDSPKFLFGLQLALHCSTDRENFQFTFAILNACYPRRIRADEREEYGF